MSDTMREKFERALPKETFHDECVSVHFTDEEYEAAYEGWQACAAQYEKELAALREYKRVHSSHEDRSRVGMGLEIETQRRELAELRAQLVDKDALLIGYARARLESAKNLYTAEAAAEERGRLAGRAEIEKKYREMEPVGYIRVYGVECLKGTLVNQTTGRTLPPSSTTIDPAPAAEDDIVLIALQPNITKEVVYDVFIELGSSVTAARALADHLEKMGGASKAEIPFRHKNISYLVTIESCAKGCDWEEPYGWVPEVGCPVHDK